MKYLRKFNENVITPEILLDDVKTFCNQYLAYLLDDTEIKLDIYDNTIFEDGDEDNEIEIILYLPNYDTFFIEKNRYWNDIKDDFIPFLDVLNNRYTGLDKKLAISSKKDEPGHTLEHVNIQDLIEDKYNNDKQLYFIAIEIDRDSKINN